MHGKNPKDKELTHSLYTGSLMNGQFATAAKMASKMVQLFDEPSFALPNIELLFIDSQKWLGGSGNQISLSLAVAFAEKYMAAQQKQNEVGAPIPAYFSKLYLKLLLAKKDFAKAQSFLESEGKRSFELWLDQRAWQVQIFFQSEQIDKACQELTEMIRFNYTQVKEDFQSIYNLHELLITLAVRACPAEVSFDFLDHTLAEASPAELFPNYSASADFLVSLYGSFRHYAHHDMTDKSVNG